MMTDIDYNFPINQTTFPQPVFKKQEKTTKQHQCPALFRLGLNMKHICNPVAENSS